MFCHVYTCFYSDIQSQKHTVSKGLVLFCVILFNFLFNKDLHWPLLAFKNIRVYAITIRHKVIVENGRYYWIVPGWIGQQRLVPKGEKYSTKDKATALRIDKKLWNQVKKNDTELTANIQKHTKVNGMATKDRAVAEKVAARLSVLYDFIFVL